jgi:hypothetical protein
MIFIIILIYYYIIIENSNLRLRRKHLYDSDDDNDEANINLLQNIGAYELPSSSSMLHHGYGDVSTNTHSYNKPPMSKNYKNYMDNDDDVNVSEQRRSNNDFDSNNSNLNDIRKHSISKLKDRVKAKSTIENDDILIEESNHNNNNFDENENEFPLKSVSSKILSQTMQLSDEINKANSNNSDIITSNYNNNSTNSHNSNIKSSNKFNNDDNTNNNVDHIHNKENTKNSATATSIGEISDIDQRINALQKFLEKARYV